MEGEVETLRCAIEAYETVQAEGQTVVSLLGLERGKYHECVVGEPAADPLLEAEREVGTQIHPGRTSRAHSVDMQIGFELRFSECGWLLQ